MEANWGCNGAFIQTEPRNDTNVIYNGSRITGVSEFWDAVCIYMYDMGRPCFVKKGHEVTQQFSQSEVMLLSNLQKFGKKKTTHRMCLKMADEYRRRSLQLHFTA